MSMPKDQRRASGVSQQAALLCRSMVTTVDVGVLSELPDL